jgi:hypothetical protein
MTDQAPPPNRPEDEPTAPQPAAAPAAAQPGAAPAAAQPAAEQPTAAQEPGPARQPAATPPYVAPSPRSSWTGRRVPLLVVVAALLIGCIAGAGVVAAGAVITHFGFHHGDGPIARHDRGWDRRPDFGRDGRGPRNFNPRPAPTITAPTPVPSTSS